MSVEGAGVATTSEQRSCRNESGTFYPVNALCLGAAILGVAAMFCAWSYYSMPGYVASGFLNDFISETHLFDSASVGGLLFIAGAERAPP
ncbi:MAG: hypothetical protein A3K75_06065 [Euryarchaeota archaeon RBG_13_61_15]|nr:MAG: hypothetical protein A3K75_06065 [Euryarchaeota archaeon RBG_13_61_15]